MTSLNHAYSDTITKKRVGIIGIQPPPLGGVSVHIQRVGDRFLSQQNKLFFFSSEQRIRKVAPVYMSKLFGWLIQSRPDHLYYHSTYLRGSYCELFMLIFFRFFFRYELTIVDHDCRHLYASTHFSQRLFRWIARKVNRIVCIGQSTHTMYADHEIVLETMSCESAFIPPLKHTAPAIEATYPSSLDTFMQDHTPLFLLSAAHAMKINDKDVYGIDATIQMLHDIRNQYPDAGLIIGLAEVRKEDKSYLQKLESLMRDCNVSEQIFFLHGNRQLWPLFERIDVFLRPTLSDGDSISVREALYFNVPVIASNCVSRPSNVIHYDVNDRESFARVVTQVLQEKIYGTERKRHTLHEKSPF